MVRTEFEREPKSIFWEALVKNRVTVLGPSTTPSVNKGTRKVFGFVSLSAQLSTPLVGTKSAPTIAGREAPLTAWNSADTAPRLPPLRVTVMGAKPSASAAMKLVAAKFSRPG